MSIGQRISKLRKGLGFSQEYVAEKLEVSRQAVSKWENDTSAPDTYNLIALAELFGVSVEYIATGKQNEPSYLSQPQYTITSQKIVGFLLLGIGLLSLVLGILLSETLIVLSFYLILGSILCFSLRKNFWLVTNWAFLALTVLVFRAPNLLCIFYPSFYSGAPSIWMIISYVFWIWLLVAVVVTAIIAIKKHVSKVK